MRDKIKEEVFKIIDNFCELANLDVEKKVEVVNADDRIIVEVNLKSDNIGYLIGYHGKTLSALESVFALMVNQKLQIPNLSLVLNVNQYRQKREEDLKKMALSAVEFVRIHNVAKHLPPMNSRERRIIHMALADLADISTESTGEGEERRVVISIKDKE